MAEEPHTVLISGCSSGIGLELAVQLAHDPRKRYQVVATMRDLEKKGTLEAAAKEALGKTLTVAQLDVCSDESVAQCLSCIQGGKVDVLVNNAGVGLVGPLEGLSIAAMQNVFDTNFFGAVRLVKAVLPGMKRRRQGHIVVVSSVMGLQGVVFNEVYAASKFALEGFFESLAIQLLQFNISVSLVEPGPVATDFEGKLLEQVSEAEFPGTDAETLGYFRDIYLPASRELFRSLGQNPQDVAQAIVRVIGSARPPLRRQTNGRYTPLTALKAADASGRLYVGTAHRLLFRWPRLLYLGLCCLGAKVFSKADDSMSPNIHLTNSFAAKIILSEFRLHKGGEAESELPSSCSGLAANVPSRGHRRSFRTGEPASIFPAAQRLAGALSRPSARGWT
ncbi:retinol dehydrogenase 8 [Choloepus didactylus]|uniref:retinol dehydrogenase 8 n=1 Tax=Choloepus didactylus TaxID=27675 RepID=UPI0018A02CAE|nr:retinol dehydrogenase 8 [Choloepus didactylus]